MMNNFRIINSIGSRLHQRVSFSSTCTRSQSNLLSHKINQQPCQTNRHFSTNQERQSNHDYHDQQQQQQQQQQQKPPSMSVFAFTSIGILGSGALAYILGHIHGEQQQQRKFHQVRQEIIARKQREREQKLQEDGDNSNEDQDKNEKPEKKDKKDKKDKKNKKDSESVEEQDELKDTLAPQESSSLLSSTDTPPSTTATTTTTSSDTATESKWKEMSEPMSIVGRNESGAYIFIGDTLNTLLHNDNDILFESYSTTCPSCERLKPVMDQVARALKEETGVMVGMMNADKNHRDGYFTEEELKYTPLLKFYPAHTSDPHKGVSYNSSPSAAKIIEFIHQHAKNKFDLQRALNHAAQLEDETRTQVKNVTRKHMLSVEEIRLLTFAPCGAETMEASLSFICHDSSTVNQKFNQQLASCMREHGGEIVDFWQRVLQFHPDDKIKEFAQKSLDGTKKKMEEAKSSVSATPSPSPSTSTSTSS